MTRPDLKKLIEKHGSEYPICKISADDTDKDDYKNRCKLKRLKNLIDFGKRIEKKKEKKTK